ncbi:unannotated protein [freshwater metagenome]|uniref:Unannotated protein n=1 Tax=freshwater metagenome TaxID=449393 RepID=A0A6J7GB01_9ZZZZ
MTTASTHRLQAHWRLQTMTAGLRVVLADGDDPRVREAAPHLVEWGITPLLVTSDPVFSDGVQSLDPRDVAPGITQVLEALADTLAQKHDLSAAERSALLCDPLNIAVAAVKVGLVDGCVAGASRPSADVARAALRLVGTAPGVSTLSSSFIMLLPDGRALAYGDCAVVPEPDAEQLAEIAIATAGTFSDVVGEEPVVAMLSFSTKGSAEHRSIEVVREATRIVRKQCPELAIDGELQFDAAFVPGVAAAKAPGSPAAGRANVFIFPNLAAGNIAYKITERLAGADAFGPLFQGLAGAVNDLSRGCSAEDILNISVITSVQAAQHVDHATAGGA